MHGYHTARLGWLVACAVAGEVFGWGNNVGGYMGVVGSPLRVAAKLPIPATTVEVQVGCKGAHWQAKTIFCHIWALTGE